MLQLCTKLCIDLLETSVPCKSPCSVQERTLLHGVAMRARRRRPSLRRATLMASCWRHRAKPSIGIGVGACWVAVHGPWSRWGLRVVRIIHVQVLEFRGHRVWAGPRWMPGLLHPLCGVGLAAGLTISTWPVLSLIQAMCCEGEPEA